MNGTGEKCPASTARPDMDTVRGRPPEMAQLGSVVIDYRRAAFVLRCGSLVVSLADEVAVVD